MSSQLSAQDKQRLLRGVTKKVGDKPYEDGYWGQMANRDRVLIELYDDNNNLIEYKDLSIGEAKIQTDEDFIKIKPGINLTDFGYTTGKFKIKYRFLRELAGKEQPILLRTALGFEDEIFNLNWLADNIHIDDSGKVYGVTKQKYLENPNGAEQLLITDYKYKIDKISSSRTEVRLTAKNIEDAIVGEGRGHQYVSDFMKLQESVRVESIVEDLRFVDPIAEATGGTSNLNAANSVEITPETGGFIFTDNMVGGTLRLPNAFLMGYQTTEVRTELDIISNGALEEVEIDTNTGFPTVIPAGWDSSIHSDAVKLKKWTSGYIAHAGGNWVGSAGIGYHAKFVRNEGNSGGICIKFIDQNNVFADYEAWPTTDTHRNLHVQQELLELQSLGATSGDLINIGFDMKSTVAGKGIGVQVVYPGHIFIELEPAGPPDGYFDPFNPQIPTETSPTSAPNGFMANTEASAISISGGKPPSMMAVMLTLFNKTHLSLSIGTTSSVLAGGPATWIITKIQSAAGSFGGTSVGPDIYTWSPNLGTEYTKEGELSTEGEWRWDGVGAWQAVSSYNSPNAPVGTVNPNDWNNVVNSHPYQYEGQGTPIFARTSAPGENAGWDAATFHTKDQIMLIKDDLVWVTEESYTNNYSKIEMQPIINHFPSLNQHTMDNGKTLYQDIFENGRIQSITRTRKTNGTGMRSGYYIIFYTDGSDDERCNKAFMVEKGAMEIGGGGIDDGIKYIADLDMGFNDVINENGGQLATLCRKDGDVWYHYFVVPGSNQYWRSVDGDGDFFEKVSGGEYFEENYPSVFADGFAGMPNDSGLIDGFGYKMYSGHWSIFSWLCNDAGGNGNLYTLSGGNATVTKTTSIESFVYGAGEVGTNGADLIFGTRHPGATNYNPNLDVIYDDGSGILEFDPNPLKDGAVSPESQWKWDGPGFVWNNLQGAPVYTYSDITNKVLATIAGGWNRYETSIEIPDNWNPAVPWFLRLTGHDSWDDSLTAATAHGVTWVDNIFADFTLTGQETSTPYYQDFEAQIAEVVSGGTTLKLNRTFEEAATLLSAENTDPTAFIEGNNPGTYDSFTISYLVYNPYDLRTYLKFGNKLHLTTNFKRDITSNPFPFSVIYKLYESLPSNIARLDECIVVKEMVDPVVETVEIVDFIDTDPGGIVLKSPDIMNAESPIQRRTTDYKTQTDILSGDALISDSLQNEFLSQSMDSVNLNIDFTAYENFINFSSAKKRIQNFRYKLKLIEDYTQISSSYIGVSGSNSDLSSYHHKIKSVKNDLDPFENYMYFKSSSFVSSSLGTFYDNAWPKTSGAGTLTSEYILAPTTSSTAASWYNEAIISASAYDTDNFNKLSNILPEHLIIDTSNDTYLTLVDMVGHHFDNIWVYIKALTDVYDRREKLTEGISRDLLMSVGQSLGWELSDGKDMLSLSRYALGKEVTGSSYTNYSDTSERDISREIWSRIINNIPFFLKNKGSVRAIKGLISAYGIPSTILRVREHGGPDLPDDAVPQFEIARKFTKALDFKNGQYVQTIWTTDDSSNRIPDTIEFRFRAATGSDQILVEKRDDSNNPDFFIRLKENASADDYGFVSFMLSGSDGYKEISSSNFPVYDGDFYSVMLARTSGSDNINVSQSYQLNVGKYDVGRSKVDKYSQVTLDVSTANSSSYNGQWSGSGTVYIGGSADVADMGVQFSGSMMEYRHWTETLNTSSFKNHIGNPKAFDGNTISSSYNNLVLRYSFDDNMDLSTDTDGIRDVSANQTTTYSGSHSGFTGNFFSNVVDETKTFIPSIGALRRVTNKIRIEDNKLKPGFSLNANWRATVSAYDTAPLDSNKVGVFFAPTDVINNDIINSVGNLNFDQYLGDPRDLKEHNYRGLDYVADNYWKKYNSPNNFWDYIRLLKYYDQSLFPQIRKMIPARAKPTLGILVEPNIFERPKTIIGRAPQVETPYYSQSINIANMVDGLIEITASYNAGLSIVDYNQWTARIDMYSYETGSSTVSSSGELLLKEATGSEIADRSVDLSIWQRLGQPGEYSDVTMSFGDFNYAEVLQPVISGSRIHGRNQKMAKFFTTEASASIGNYHSSSFYNVDIDNLADERQAWLNSYYNGVKNTVKTTQDGGPPVEIIITSPTKLVTKAEGESSLVTGEGIVSKFKPKKRKKKGGRRKGPKIKRKPASLEKAMEAAMAFKGNFLNLKESKRVIFDFDIENKIKPRKKKKVKRPRIKKRKPRR